MATEVKSINETAGYSRIGIDDFYWLAVPLWDLQEEAGKNGAYCTSTGSDELHKCSESSVKLILCDCVSQCESIVNAANQYFLDQIYR